MIKENQILLESLNDISNWSELKKRLENFNTSQSETTNKKTIAGRIFECFSKYYFLTDPEKRDLYKNVWHYEEIPHSIKKSLKLPHVDHGIDILLQDIEGKYHAVQCKFKNDESKSLSWSGDKIANVFALATNCDKIIVFSNASDVTKVAKAFSTKYEQILIDTLLDLPTEFFNNIQELARGNQPAELQKFTPQQHQQTAISKVVQHLKTNDRGQLILPCGAGKTLTSLWIKEDLKSKATLVLVPSLALLKQTKNDWARHKNQKYRSLYVCSEKDINKKDIDSPIIHTYEIGGPVTTSSSEIKSFLERDFDKVIFSTYQSITSVSDASLQIEDFSFDLIICDEAHRTAGSKKKNTFTIVHDNQKLNAVKRLYMTATPKVASTSLKTKLGEDYSLLCDMSNPDIFGTEAYRMSFGEAIEKGILVDYKIIGIGVTDKDIKKYIQERELIGQITAEDLAHNFALNLVMNKHNALHGLTFHSRVILAQEFAIRHEKYFDKIYSESVNGKQTTSYRKRILDEFKNSKKGIVSNSRCLTEGVDVPTIDLIYFCDPKSSKIDIVQASGRALRKDPTGKKKQGLIVVPVFHHIDQDVEIEIKNNPIFNYLIQVVRALCDQDERLEAEINNLSSKKGKRTNSKIEIDFSNEETERIIILEGLETKLKESLFDIIIEKNRTPASRWDDNYQILVKYFKKEGHSNVPSRYILDKTLGTWAVAQRVNKNKNALSLKQIDKLDLLNFNWNPINNVFDEYCIKLVEFRKIYGHTNVPVKSKDFPKLGTWTNKYRSIINHGNLQEDGSIKCKEGQKYGSLTKIQIEQLETLGFDKGVPRSKWMVNYMEFKNYYDTHGHLKFSQANSTKLYYKKYRFSKNASKLTFEQKKLLTSIGFDFLSKKDANYSALSLFYTHNNHYNITAINEPVPGIYNWLSSQRRLFKLGKLPVGNVIKFEQINFDFNVHFLKN